MAYRADYPFSQDQGETLNESIALLARRAGLIANALGGYDKDLTWAGFQAHVRDGDIGDYIRTADQMNIKENGLVTVAASGAGVTGATVDKDTFVAAVSSQTGVYDFSYSGSVWALSGKTVTLGDYGISVTGDPVEGDAVIATYSASNAVYDVEGIDEEAPADSAFEHVVSLIRHDILGLIPFDPAQYLVAVTQGLLESLGITGTALPAGVYNIVEDHGAYNGSTNEDGQYQFTTTVDIPVGGGIRHTTMGLYQSAGYSPAKVLAGTFTTYGADTTTVLESGISCALGSEGTNLGTTTCLNPTYKSGDFVNFTQRNCYGSNRWSTSYLRQVLNSRDAVVAWEPGTIFSRNWAGNSPEGLLHALDPALVAVLGRVKKRYALSVADGYGFEDVEDTVTLATMLDVYGSKNNSIAEGPVDSNGDLTRTTQMSLWAGTAYADKIKTLGGTPRIWWLSSALPSHASIERGVDTSGALSNYGAYISYGAVPVLHII